MPHTDRLATDRTDRSGDNIDICCIARPATITKMSDRPMCRLRAKACCERYLCRMHSICAEKQSIDTWLTFESQSKDNRHTFGTD